MIGDCVVLSSFFEMSELDFDDSMTSLSSTPARPHAKQTEREQSQERVGDVDAYHSPCWTELTKRFGDHIHQEELKGIAELLSKTLNVKLDRAARRRKKVLVKWFFENWDELYPYLDYVAMQEVPVSEN